MKTAEFYCFRENCTLSPAAEPILSTLMQANDKKPCLAILYQPNLEVRYCKPFHTPQFWMPIFSIITAGKFYSSSAGQVYMLVLQVIVAAAFSNIGKDKTVLFILLNSHLWNLIRAGPLEDIRPVSSSYNTKLEVLQINMPPNSSLKTLILSHNNLSTVSPAWFINTPNLTEISLANNSLCEYMVHLLFYRRVL